jgi:hypothetical protein
MKKITKIALIGTMALSISLMLGYATECSNVGIVTGNTDCSTAQQCKNFDENDCDTAVTIVAFPNTGSVKGAYINNTSTVCSTNVDCEWNYGGCEVVGQPGSTNNANKASQGSC